MTKWQRWVQYWRGVRAAFTPSDSAWHGAVVALRVVVVLIALAIFVTDVVPDFSFGKLVGFLAAVAALLVAGLLLRLVLRMFASLSLRYRATLFLLLPLFLLMLLPPGGPKGGPILALALLVITATLGAGIAVLRRDGFHPARQKVTLSALALGSVLLVLGLGVLVRSGEDPNPALTDFVLENRSLDLPNPGKPGTHLVRTLTYGSGTDRQRAEFGDGVGLVARSVDGSQLIENWEGPGGWLRTRYWGFDATELPLQARVWYPEGEGPFPLVLIVHGNHSMEDFSDPGYGYLGELFASRGIILASVDENFLNSSTSDLANMLGPGLTEENDARGWLLLEHLAQWRDWNADPEHPFGGRVDMDRLALIGHSRGGEAVAVAAAFNELGRYPDDATLTFDYGFNLRGIIAIAPADGQYKPRERGTPLRDINYFVIHGSLDGDVQSFMGSSQYSRVGLTHDPSRERFRFKSTLYVKGANHGQFNTSWGRNDFGGGFFGLALDTRPIMDPEEQRDVARVYFSAFLEVVLKDEMDYLPVFRDARRAADWLPATYYLHDYADTSDVVVANFDEDLDPTSTTRPDGAIDASRVTKWREEWISLKWNPLDTHVAVIAWDDEAEEETASWSVALPEDLQTTLDSQLVFSLAPAEEGTLPDDWEDEDAEEATTEPAEDDEPVQDDDEAKPLDWSIVLVDAAGEESRLALSHDRLLYPRLQTPTRRASFLEMVATSEVILHRYQFDLREFSALNPEFDTTAIRGIRFDFDVSAKGAIVVDNVAFADPSPSRPQPGDSGASMGPT